MRPRVVVFLQNAWSPEWAGDIWPRESWLRAMWASRSGNKMMRMLKHFKLSEVWVDNTTPICGDTPSSIVPPDLHHIAEVLTSQEPEVVVACGRQAANVIEPLWRGSLLVVPHPACRIVTNALYDRANRMLLAGFKSRSELLQLRGSVKRIKL